MTDNEIRQIFENLDNCDHAMLVTERDGELRSRPMVIGDYTDDGRIRFITRDDSEKVAEIDEYPKVNVALHGDSTFLSVSGNARLTKDRELIDKSWQQTQRPWFSEGRNDPHVMVLEVIPSFVEYWHRSDSGVIQSIFNQAQEALGITPDGDSAKQDTEHRSIDLSGRPL